MFDAFVQADDCVSAEIGEQDGDLSINYHHLGIEMNQARSDGRAGLGEVACSDRLAIRQSYHTNSNRTNSPSKLSTSPELPVISPFCTSSMKLGVVTVLHHIE